MLERFQPHSEKDETPEKSPHPKEDNDLRVALDGTPLTVPNGGIARYTAELSSALAETFPEDGFWLLSDQKVSISSMSRNLKLGTRPANFPERRWWLWGLRREMSRLRIDLFHGTDFSVPYLPLRPSVMTIHDVSPWMDAGWHTGADRIRRRTRVLLRLGLASMVITPTEAVRRQVMERFHLKPDRIRAVPEAASPHFRPVASPAANPPYFLFVGTLEPRKNIELIINAWRDVRRTLPIDLVLAGRRRADFPAIEPQNGLRVLGEVPDDALPGLYSAALACLYPSLYEGFGLPVLEAMQCGAPVIASRDPALTEVAEGAAVHLCATDTKAWIEAMHAAATQPEWLMHLRQKGLARAAQFSWVRTAKLTREVYEEATARFVR